MECNALSDESKYSDEKFSRELESMSYMEEFDDRVKRLFSDNLIV